MFLFINCEQSSQAQSLKKQAKGMLACSIASKTDLKVCCPQRQSVISGRGPRPHLEVLSINIKLQSAPSTYRSSSSKYIYSWLQFHFNFQVDAQIISCFSKYELELRAISSASILLSAFGLATYKYQVPICYVGNESFIQHIFAKCPWKLATIRCKLQFVQLVHCMHCFI